jgi:hypothetical protein
LQECHRAGEWAKNPLRSLAAFPKIIPTVIRISAIFQAEGDVIGTAILTLFILVYVIRDTEVIDDLVVMMAW